MDDAKESFHGWVDGVSAHGFDLRLLPILKQAARVEVILKQRRPHATSNVSDAFTLADAAYQVEEGPQLLPLNLSKCRCGCGWPAQFMVCRWRQLYDICCEHCAQRSLERLRSRME